MITESISCDGIPKPISRIGLGTWAIGGAMWGGSNDGESIKTIQHAVDVGINLIDTAPVYGFGHSEEIVGQALAEGGRRDKAVLATKVALEWVDGKVFRNSSPARIRKEIEDSLRRLRTDRIDIYQIHWPDSTVPIEETAETMLELHREGKVLALGVSNFSPQQMETWRRVAPLHSTQPPYNIFEREIEADVLPYALNQKLIVLSYGAICRGLLSGKMSRARKFEGDDLRLQDPKFLEPRYSQYLAAVDLLAKHAQANYGKSVLAFAVRWILDRGETMTALWGARNAAQLDQVEEAFGWKISADDYTAVEEILRKTIHDPVGPEFMAPPNR
ncbi:MAG TPA: aldo/keto reductase [Chthoniobacterales bacterium]|jgi:aryl-alcohol dehydrogenase-like predicted oxidoreductase|nr:aldo/keto reductase [Chthoniobacterales bacterium]